MPAKKKAVKKAAVPVRERPEPSTKSRPVFEAGQWLTADGRKIAYGDLTDDHLTNIIRDGYRNSHIRREAAKRGISVPVRAVDKLTMPDLMMWIETFRSVSLSGNQAAKAMLKMWNDGKPDPNFYFNLNRFLEAQEKRKEESSRILKDM